MQSTFLVSFSICTCPNSTHMLESIFTQEYTTYITHIDKTSGHARYFCRQLFHLHASAFGGGETHLDVCPLFRSMCHVPQQVQLCHSVRPWPGFLTLSISFSFSHCLSFTHSLSLLLSRSLARSLALSHTVSLFLSLSLSLLLPSLSLSLVFALTLFLSHCA